MQKTTDINNEKNIEILNIIKEVTKHLQKY